MSCEAMLKICKNCRYWTRYMPESYEVYREHFGTCHHERFLYGGVVGYHPDNSNSLYYWDFESYAAGFATGEDFGCVHWEKRRLDMINNRIAIAEALDSITAERNSSTLKWAVNYALYARRMIADGCSDEDLKTQILYVLNNITHWRNPVVKGVRATLKKFVKEH